jgi:hypothetical protein
MRPSDGEIDTETLIDFDSIFERSQNHKPGLIHTIRRSRTEIVEHEVGGHREISHKSKKNSQEQRFE